MSKRVFITSRSFASVDDESLELLKRNGIEAVFATKDDLSSESKLIEALNGFETIILGNDKITEAVMRSSPELRLICKHGTGVDNIDIETARYLGIKVTKVPATNADAVADLTFALILDVARRVSYAAKTVHCGKWSKVIGMDVFGKTLGLIGLGEIGKRVAKRADGFGMTVLAFDPHISSLPFDVKGILTGFDDVLRQADFLSLHVPLNKNTKNLIGEKELAMMKKGSFLINTSRGGVIDEEALYASLVSGHLKGAGLDVLEKEPPEDCPLMALDNVTIVPHMASHSVEAINAVSIACASNVVRFFSGKEVVCLLT